MKPIRRWQDQYLQEGTDDGEYDSVADTLMNCPDCREWGNLGWKVVPIMGGDGEVEPSQEFCSRCFGTGKILE
jgi:hypothetical protein